MMAAQDSSRDPSEEIENMPAKLKLKEHVLSTRLTEISVVHADWLNASKLA